MGQRLAGWGSGFDRALRPLCRCDGLKDAAVIAALLAVVGALVLRLAGGPGGPAHAPLEEHRAVAPALLVHVRG